MSDDVNSIIYHELLCRIWNIGRKKIDTSSLLQRLYKSAFKSNFTLFLFLLNFQIRHYLRTAPKGEYTGRNNSVGTHKGFISDTKYLILNFIFLNTQHSAMERFLISRIFTRKKRALNYWSVNNYDRTCDWSYFCKCHFDTKFLIIWNITFDLFCSE